MTSSPGTQHATRRAALDDLDQRWGHRYDLACTGREWVAQRLDDGRMLTAASPAALDRLITADHARRPVPCGQPSR